MRALEREGMTMIVVTHEMGFARDVGDRVVFMDGGVIVEEGPARQVIDNPQEERNPSASSGSCSSIRVGRLWTAAWMARRSRPGAPATS